MCPPGRELFWIYSLISVVSQKTHFYIFSFFFCLSFKIDLIPPGYWLQPPIRTEYKLNQSSATTAASDKSLSNTLMPSNCLRSPLPVCFSTWTPSQPHPSQRCPSAPSPLPVSITAGFLSHMSCFITGRPRVASVLLNRVKSSAAQVRGARWNTRRLFPCFGFLIFPPGFWLVLRLLLWNLPGGVFLRPGWSRAITGMPKKNQICASVSDHISSTPTLDLQIH